MSETEDYGGVEDTADYDQGVEENEYDDSSDGLDRIHDRMEEMAANQQALAEAINQNYYADDEDYDDDEDEEPVEFEDENGQLTEDGARALIADMVAEQVADQLSPRDYANQIAERDESFDDLRDEIPELQDDRIAGAVLSRALDWASNVDPGIVDRPEFVDLIEATYKAMKYDEGPSEPSEREVVLGSAQGAAPQGRDDDDWEARIVQAAERQRPKI